MYDQVLQDTFQTIRIPLYGGESSSHETVTDNPDTTDGALINLVPRTIPNTLTGANEFVVTKREGHNFNMNVATKTALAGTFTCRDFICISALSDVFVGAYLRNNSGTRTIEIVQIRPFVDTTTVIGTISTVAGPPAVNVSASTVVYLSEIKQGLVPGVAVVITDPNEGAGTSAAYYALSSSGVFTAASLTKISDADFPTNQTPYLHIVGPLVQFNQISYVMGRNGNIYNSNDDNIGTWAALGFLEAQSYADRGVGLIRYKHHIVAAGDTTIEFFNDAGNDPTLGSPLERTEQAFIKFGALYGKSIINIDDTLFWISNSNPETVGLWKLEGYTPTKVSTHKIDSLIAGVNSGRETWNLQTAYYAGCRHLMLSSGSSRTNSFMFNTTFSYDVNEPQYTSDDITLGIFAMNLQNNIWWIYNSDEYLSETDSTLYFASPVSDPNNSIVFSQYIAQGGTANTETACIMQSRPSTVKTTDYSATSAGNTEFVTLVELPIVWFGNEKRKFLHKYKVGLDVGLRSADDTIPNKVKLVTTKDDYVTFQVRNSPLLSDTTKLERLYWNNFGAFRKLRSAIIYKGSSPLTIRFVEWDVSQGVF